MLHNTSFNKAPQFSLVLVLSLLTIVWIGSTGLDKENKTYVELYQQRLLRFSEGQSELISFAKMEGENEAFRKQIEDKIYSQRLLLKQLDFWLRYLRPIDYKLLNGPLPVEWETEVYEKFEPPYKRPGAGLTLAHEWIDRQMNTEDLFELLKPSTAVVIRFSNDSITNVLQNPANFYYSNRLFLLNLAAIYTTGFECPDQEKVIPELLDMATSVSEIYAAFATSFPDFTPNPTYLALYNKMLRFIASQPQHIDTFNHYLFLKDYVSPLFSINQQSIRAFEFKSKSMSDFSINDQAEKIFSKKLYWAQNEKGIYQGLKDIELLAEIENLGQLLFYDPILSGNNKRSCASCHKPDQFFTDTTTSTSLQFNGVDFLSRNTPTLVNSPFNHLLMLDGIHYSLQNQALAVMTNSLEMNSQKDEIRHKVLSVKAYKTSLEKIAKSTPKLPKIDVQHISSALTLYYNKFSTGESKFDKAMNNDATLTPKQIDGFNLFMGKAQCATCHFVPQFNGVKPPYTGSEFEVLGTPADTLYTKPSNDRGRFDVFAVAEMKSAFRTGTVRNAEKTAPYMHNGVFGSLKQVIEFYNNGGGNGHGFTLENQTLGSDSLHLTPAEINAILSFIHTLNEEIPEVVIPSELPISKIKSLNQRIPKGVY